MTVDLTSVKVGDIVTGRFESKVARIHLNDTVPYVVTEDGWYISEGESAWTEVTFTTPKTPLPTTWGSVVKVGNSYYILGIKGWIHNNGGFFRNADFKDVDYVVLIDAGKNNG